MAVRVSSSRIKFWRWQGEKPQSMHCLGAQEVERLADVGAGDTIVCTNGVLWVTQAGDLGDYLLKKGEHFVASQPGKVLVQALNEPACWRYTN